MEIQAEEQKQAYIQREQDKRAALEARANEVVSKLEKKFTKLAQKGLRWGTIQRPVKTTAEHHSPRSRSTPNVCKPDDLIEESALIYHKCVHDLGLDVQIRYWHEKDYDEPGAYHGGYEMVAVW